MNSRPASGSAEPRFLTHMVRVDEIPPKGLDGRLEATAPERQAIADALDLPRLDALVFDYTFRPVGKRRMVLKGTLSASGAQRCVVTLEPVETSLDEEVELEFWPEEDLARTAAAEEGLDLDVDLDAPEPIEGGEIDLGRLAYEILASSLDPYPRKPGAELDWKDEDAAAGGGKDSPFAALESLRRDKK